MLLARRRGATTAVEEHEPMVAGIARGATLAAGVHSAIPAGNGTQHARTTAEAGGSTVHRRLIAAT